MAHQLKQMHQLSLTPAQLKHNQQLVAVQLCNNVHFSFVS
jgi:hypothetical protein